ncbi:MAG: flagellar motor protein MotA [Parvibaculaceae bacterium]|nr:flagellar motor protein MotA [Parvibaculaceae bacterium]
MAKDYSDSFTLSKPRAYLTRMALFLTLVGFLLLILYSKLITAFLANPGLNGLIVFVLVIGILYAVRQVFMLHPEINWVNSFRRADPGLALPPPPQLLAPMATILGNRRGRMNLSAQTMASLLDSIGSRLDEQREISRYAIGLLVFLGLLGTFWGLLSTVAAVGDTMRSLNVESTDSTAVFTELRAGLEAPLKGMGTAFSSSSLFGLAGSLVLGFLDLQAGQAQNRFFNELEEWMATVTDVLGETAPQASAIAEGTGTANTALLALTGQIAALTEQIQLEQGLMRQMSENQTQLKPALENLLTEFQKQRD